MAQYQQLNEDKDIVIQILPQPETTENDKNKITITLRNTKSENTNITFDLKTTKFIRELKKEVNIFSIRSSKQSKLRREKQ